MFKKFIKIITKDLNRSFNAKNDIRKDELKLYMKKGAIIIDVRSYQEYMEGHINGALSMPYYDIGKIINYKIPNRNEFIILYCSSGMRSKKAQRILQSMGYKNVYNVYNGIE